MQGIISYTREGNEENYFFNFFPIIDYNKVLQVLADTDSINIKECFIEVGHGETYQSFGENDFSGIDTVEQLKEKIISLGDEVFLQKLKFSWNDQIDIYIYEDFNIELSITDSRSKEKVITLISSILDQDYSKIAMLLKEANVHEGKYLSIDEEGNITDMYSDFDSYLSSLK